MRKQPLLTFPDSGRQKFGMVPISVDRSVILRNGSRWEADIAGFRVTLARVDGPAISFALPDDKEIFAAA